MSDKISAHLVSCMNDTLRAIADIARVSMANDGKEYGYNRNERLLHYLAKNGHWTPFAHATATLYITAPISIRTQAFKHKVGLVENEQSRRYIKTTPAFYVPSFRQASENIKQGSIDEPHKHDKEWQIAYNDHCKKAVDLYETMIADGVPAEQARFVLPQSTMTTWYWTGSLVAFARFVKQRLHPHAQKEIQELAGLVSDELSRYFGEVWDILTEEMGCFEYE